MLTDQKNWKRDCSSIASPAPFFTKGSASIAALGMAGPTLRFVGPDLV